MELKPGQRMRSVVCTAEVVVVTGSGDVDLRCGGLPMGPIDGLTPAAGTDGAPLTGMAGGAQVGKRYVGEAGTPELLCTKPGAGTLSVGATPLEIKGAKPLPSSD
jgi:hypothetical protein